LSVKLVGRGLLPLCVPLKPKLVDAPAANDAFQLTPRAVTCAPAWVTVADQAWVTCCAPA
jgi:hypothetical protein